MASVITGTTPSLKYTFNTVTVTDITTAYLTVKQAGVTIIEKNLSEATIGENYLLWKFTQEETLALKIGPVESMVNWKLYDGTRGASRPYTWRVTDNFKREVI